MIDKSIYSKEYINERRDEFKCDPSILERTIFASGLLEAMVLSGFDFIFKGGSSLLFLLEKPYRLSTDIDIIVKPGTDILDYVKKASQTYPFIKYEENIRKGINNIEKRHYKFFYKSLTNETKEIPILLDVLYEENHYSNIIEKEIKNDLIITNGPPVKVKMPSAECLLGDKMTAFAPNTIGVRPYYEKENGTIVDKKTETIKQFFDCSSLFDCIKDFNNVIDTYYKTAKSEIGYRGLDISPEECLEDTMTAAASIMSRGKIDKESYNAYYQDGIRNLKNFLININFNPETAIKPAAKVMYLSACIMKKVKPISKIGEQELIEGDFAKLNFIRKIDKESFNMAAYALKIMYK